MFKKTKIMLYYDGSKSAKTALSDTMEYMAKLKPTSGPTLSILLDNKDLRNEVFTIISGKDKDFTPAFHIIKEGATLENLKFIEKLIDNTKSTMLLLPSSCRFIQEKQFYDELNTIHSSLVIIR